MISVDRSFEVNPQGTPPHLVLDRHAVWGGLVLKAENAVPFVEAITSCFIVERDATGFVREVVVMGETLREHVTFFPEEKVVYKRLSGSAMGVIENRIEEQDGKLRLRFTFDLELEGADAEAEQGFAAGMETSYLAAVKTTLDRIRAKPARAVNA